MVERFVILLGLFGLGGVVYIYGGYLALLRVIGMLARAERHIRAPVADDCLPALTVYFSAYNEEELVGRRLLNLVGQDYPRERVEIVVVSDGSTDGTVDEAKRVAAAHAGWQIRVVDGSENRGRHFAQNLVAREARHDILVATDADAEFAPGFLRVVGETFCDPRVGVGGGVVVYRRRLSKISDSIRTYRGMEHALRAAEERLGILAKTDGPCTAYRREVWQEIEEFEDLDHVVVIFARVRGLEAVQMDEAICYDTPNSAWRQELRARSRMTRKGLLSIHKRWRAKQITAYPGFSFALYSHRHVRYMSPAFLLCLMVGACGVGVDLIGWLSMMVVLVGIAMVGALLAWLPWQRVRGWWGPLESFLVANAGFAYGIYRWLRGDRTGRYRPARFAG